MIEGRGQYLRHTIDIASGGSGRDYFVLSLPGFNYLPSETKYEETYVKLPDLYNGQRPAGAVTNYNPFLSQSQDSLPFSSSKTAYGVSPLTFRTRITDFKVGEDKLDLTNFGIDTEMISNKSLSKLSGTAFVNALNVAIKSDGYALMVGKSNHTSNNTTLFVVEAGIDTNDNGKVNDTLVEIQLVGLTTSSISAKLFGDAPTV